MSEENNPETYQERPILEIIRKIHEGTIKGDELSPDIRQGCVEYLWQTEGHSVVAIASALHVSERTIKRDKSEIRKRNAQKPSADYALETIGELIQKATSAHEHLMRLSRSSVGSVQEKSQAAYYVCKAVQEQAKLLQSLGYLPERPMQIEADIHDHHEEEESPAQLKDKLAELEKLVAEDNENDPEILKLIETAKKQIALAEANNTIGELKRKLSESDKEQGTANEQGR